MLRIREPDWYEHRLFKGPDTNVNLHVFSDGCSEIERMFFTRGMHGLTLYPGRAYLEVSVQLYNRTGERQTFLWWANPAVHVNDDYQSVFPPDVHAVVEPAPTKITRPA